MSTNKPILSFEFFPPKTQEGMDKLHATRKQLAQLNPEFFSVTFGAGGSTRDRTLETVIEIQREGHKAAPHLSCIGSTRENIRAILAEYKSHGIRHIVALRGDMPSGIVAHVVPETRTAGLETELRERLLHENGENVFISAKSKEGIEELRERMTRLIKESYVVRYPHQVKGW